MAQHIFEKKIESKGRVVGLGQPDLQQRILEEMTVSYANALEKNFEVAKQFIRITPEGKVDVLLKDKLTGKDQILLYLLGKMYAKEAGLAPSSDAGNQELSTELGIPLGSLMPWLKNLRDTHRIKSVTKNRHSYHSISINCVEKTLSIAEKRVQGNVM